MAEGIRLVSVRRGVDPRRFAILSFGGAAGAASGGRGRRNIHLGKWRDVPIYALDDLAPGQTIDGAAVVESATTTVLLRPGDRASANAFGWLDIKVAASE
jgi:N-methylhydantoinase A/oxoprolinase/acetone carboxylase beta subunit